MAAPSFCDAVLNALGRDSYPADCGGASCPQRCLFPDESGGCPASAVAMAQKTDLVRRSSGRAREVFMAQLDDAGAQLWEQYKIDEPSVSWEDICERCRLPDGRKRSRQDLAMLGYDYKSRPLFFARLKESGDSAAEELSWLSSLENRPAGESTLAEAVDAYVPLYADRFLPPVLAFFLAVVFLLLLVVALVVAMVRLSRPDRLIVVRPPPARGPFGV